MNYDESDWLNITSGWGSHRRMLLRALKATQGSVLELGTGNESTPYLHQYCLEAHRTLMSCDSDEAWLSKFKPLASAEHTVALVKKDYSDSPLWCPYGVVLIDHWPWAQRHVDAIRAAKLAQIVVIHDSEDEPGYQLDKVWPHFKFKVTDNLSLPWTTAVSNFIDLSTI